MLDWVQFVAAVDSLPASSPSLSFVITILIGLAARSTESTDSNYLSMVSRFLALASTTISKGGVRTTRYAPTNENDSNVVPLSFLTHVEEILALKHSEHRETPLEFPAYLFLLEEIIASLPNLPLRDTGA
jgi:hypothetical protein